jgi:hypothetical protein
MKWLKFIALIECIVGFFLLSSEIIDYIYLSVVQGVDKNFGGIVDLFKYKESCYKNLFLYLLVTITGISFWLNRKFCWMLTEILLITLFFVITFNLCTISLYRLGISICLESLLLLIFIYLEMRICNSSFLQRVGISKTEKYLCFLGGGLSCAIWLTLCLL